MQEDAWNRWQAAVKQLIDTAGPGRLVGTHGLMYEEVPARMLPGADESIKDALVLRVEAW